MSESIHNPSEPLARDVRRTRNVCVVAHINAGKTTLTERILFDSGRQRHCGDVDSGTATMDWTTEERDRGISIVAGVSRLSWRGYTIQVVDTPGHVDFSAEVTRSVRVADGAIVVVDGVRGVESQTEAVWRVLDSIGLPRLVFVNKLDRETASFERALASLREAFPAQRFAPVVRPWPESGALRTLVDVLGGRVQRGDACADVPSERLDAWRDALDELAADFDEQTMAAFCAGLRAPLAAVAAGLRIATLGRSVIPVLCGSALRNRGVEPLLDAVCQFLPAPSERDHAELRPDAAGPLIALVFQSGLSAAGDGRFEALLRIYSGTLAVGSRVESPGAGEFTVEQLAEPHGVAREPIRRAGPGDLVALTVPWQLRSGATVRTPGTDIELEAPTFPTPVLSIRLEPERSEDLARLVTTARAIAASDPTLDVRFDDAQGILTASGLGELHLEVLVERIERAFGAGVRAGRPAVQSFATVEGPGRGEAALERRLGDTVLRAAARVAVRPEPQLGVPALHWAFDAEAVGLGGASRAELAAGLLAGLEGGADPEVEAVRGVAVDVLEVAVDGRLEMALPLAVEAIVLATRRACRAAGRALVEPWVSLVVTVPPDALSACVADLRARDAELRDVTSGWQFGEIRAELALVRCLGYATRLRSMTRGKGDFVANLTGLRPRAPRRGAAGRDGP
ncbi:MAG: GTP-binding protein [Planctomycetes bacterium]|nr:GTP-binding protein [Planctomycetota bacterium]